MPLDVGDRLGHYNVTALIGAPGFARSSVKGLGLDPDLHQLERRRDLVQSLLARRVLGAPGGELLKPVRSRRRRELPILIRGQSIPAINRS